MQHPEKEPSEAAPLRVLVVDDDPAILMATARVLRRAGFEVLEASDGAGCLQQARTGQPALVLLDVVLPDANGLELCQRLKEDPATAGQYVMLLSGEKTQSDHQSEGLEKGADGYLARPVSNRELVARVESMVRIIRAERERDRLIQELQQALSEIKTLRGLLPVCSHCKKVRDDNGYWEKIENYLFKHGDIEVTHGICPDCVEEHFGDLMNDEDE